MTAKPASAPQSDSLQAIVAEMRGPWLPNVDVSQTLVRAWAIRIEAIAADGLSRIDGMEFYLHENPDSTGNEEPVRLVMAMSVGDKVFCHRITQGDNGVCKPASEPVPVAQGDAMRTLLINLDVLTIAPTGSTVLNENAKHVIREAHRAIADHARRDAEAARENKTLWQQNVELREGVLPLHQRIEALEASLAACRAESFADRVLSEFHDRTAEIGQVWPPEAHRQRRVGAMHKAISAAIDALRQEAPHAE